MGSKCRTGWVPLLDQGGSFTERGKTLGCRFLTLGVTVVVRPPELAAEED
jgi:hypothetical protein